MKVDVYVYKRFDTDILSLHDAGYDISRMIKDSLKAYANGQPLKIFIEETVPLDLNNKKSFRLRITIDKSDENVVSLIEKVKHGYRSNFCKQILRNALLQQNLVCYMADISYAKLHLTNAAYIDQTQQGIVTGERYKTLAFKNDRGITLIPEKVASKSEKTAPVRQQGSKMSVTNEDIPVHTNRIEDIHKEEQTIEKAQNTIEEIKVPESIPEKKTEEIYEIKNQIKEENTDVKNDETRFVDENELMNMFDNL